MQTAPRARKKGTFLGCLALPAICATPAVCCYRCAAGATGKNGIDQVGQGSFIPLWIYLVLIVWIDRDRIVTEKLFWENSSQDRLSIYGYNLVKQSVIFMSQLRLYFLGPFRLALDGEFLSGITSAKIRSLLAYLAMEPGRPFSRESLAELLWPDRPPGTAAQNLRQSLSRLGKAIPGSPPFLIVDHQSVQFNPAADYSLDVAEFTKALDFTRGHAHRLIQHCRRCCARLESAVSLFQGEFLAGLVADSPAFDEWALLQREWMQREALGALDVLAGHWLWRGDYSQAYRFAWRQVELDAWGEAGHQKVMIALEGMGRRSEALAQYERLCSILRQELGVAPAFESTALYEQIKSGSLSAGNQPAVERTSPARGLPVVHTPFVGRGEELAQISERIDRPNCHLLTLVGPGGVGKSRLAIQTAREKSDEYPHGTCFVPLSTLNSGSRLLASLLASLELPNPPGEQTEEGTRERLLAYLRGREMLLILDNYEQLLPDTGLVRQILAQAPRVKLLVTSRQPLDLQAEWILDISGLSYPFQEDFQGATLAEMPQYEAVQLFSQNASRLGGGFSLTADNAPGVARICWLVEGMPLALELAAAWARSRPPEQIAAEIEKSLDFLGTSQADADPRHRNLRAVFERSWELLSADEQGIFSGLSVFKGGFSAQAAAQVLETVETMLAALVEKSLLRRNEAGRYDIHEVLRQYAAEKLSANLEAAGRAADRHASYYASQLAGQAESLLGPGTQEAQARLRADFDNLRAAWERAARRQMWAAIREAWPALGRYYLLTSNLEEASAAFDLAIECARDCTAGAHGYPRDAADCSGLLGGLLAERAHFLVGTGNYPQALTTAEEALKLSTAAEDLSVRAQARLAAANAHIRLGEYPAAASLLRAAEVDAQKAGLPPLQADSLRQQAHIAVRQGDYPAAEAYYQQSLEISRAHAYLLGEAYALSGLGNVSLVRERPSEARSFYQSAQQIYAAIGDQVGAMVTLDNTGTTYWAEGEYGQAQAIHSQVLGIRRKIGDRRGEGATLVKLAIQRHYQGDFIAGQRYYAQGLAIYREIGYRRGQGEILAHQCLLYHHQGRNEAAVELGRQAVILARDMGDRSDLAHALNFLGHALLAHSEPAQAGAAYAESLTLRQELGEYNRAMEPQAGLTQLALRGGDLTQAQAHAQSILIHLESRGLEVTDEPERVYLACAQALSAAGDRRARQVISEGCRLLRSRAGKIAEEALRSSYLEATPVRKKLLEMERESG
jgi:predicted ATPase/DNA-binding SARP family transcriptional activator